MTKKNKLHSSELLKEHRFGAKKRYAVKSARANKFIDGKGKNKNVDYTIFEHHDNVKEFTQEEIDEANKELYARNDAGAKLAIADGYVQLPIFSENIYGKPQEMKAWVPPTFEPSWSKGFFEKHGMNYNIYVPSYHRANDCATAEMLKKFHVDNWYLMVNPDEYEDYKAVYPINHIVLRDVGFEDPEMFQLSTSIHRPTEMSGTAGVYNNLLAFSRSIGEDKFFTMDDDFIGMALKTYKGPGIWKSGGTYKKEDFYRCSNIEEEFGFNFSEFLHMLESFAQKIRNHGFVGLEKFGIVFALPPQIKVGTRVYSFYLTDCKTQRNHVGAMNNDVITSIEQSKHGFPPCLLEVIGYNSKPTQGSGGLTDQYKLLGTLEKGKILVKNEPNIARISYNYNRVHHFVNYNAYTQQHLVGAVKK